MGGGSAPWGLTQPLSLQDHFHGHFLKGSLEGTNNVVSIRLVITIVLDGEGQSSTRACREIRQLSVYVAYIPPQRLLYKPDCCYKTTSEEDKIK